MGTARRHRLQRAPDEGARTYATTDEAVAAFIKASRDGSVPELLAILGPGSEDIISSGDTIADAKERAWFVARFDSTHTLVESAPDQLTLDVGADDWPLADPADAGGRQVALGWSGGTAGDRLPPDRAQRAGCNPGVSWSGGGTAGLRGRAT